MAFNFRPIHRMMAFIFKPAPIQFVSPDHEVWFVIKAVQSLDLTPILKTYREDGQGNTACHPEAMTTLLLYAYVRGMRSSRKIEEACVDSLSFRAIVPGWFPDHSTICRFRADHEEALSDLFTQILALCRKAGLVDPGTSVLDGTKIEANAALSANKTLETIQKTQEFLATCAKDTEKRAETLSPTQKAAIVRGQEDRKDRLDTCEKMLIDRKEAVEVQFKIKAEARAKKEAETGKKLRGRKPQSAPSPEELSRGRINTTDPDSRIMKSPKGFVQGYNAQAVATTNQIILAAEITQERNDFNQLHPMVEAAREECSKIGLPEGSIKVFLADAGYCSAENLAPREGKTLPEFLIPPKKDSELRAVQVAYRNTKVPVVQEPRTTPEAMVRYLATDEGHERYKVRGSTIEPIFGQIKGNRKITRFMRRGLSNCRSEWRLICASHNLMKLWAHSKGILSATG